MHQKNVVFDSSMAVYETKDRMPRESIPCKTFRKLADDEFVEDIFPQNKEFRGVSNEWQIKV